VLLAPLLYQLTARQADALKQFVADGGTLIMTYFSGIVDEHEHIWLGGYPALLQEILGLVVEEWHPLMPDESSEIRMTHGQSPAVCSHWVDLLHTTTAETVAVYTQGFFAGRPAITRNRYGRGTAYYVGTLPAEAALTQLLGDILRQRAMQPPIVTPAAVETAVRVRGDKTYLFVINHGREEAAVDFQATRGIDLLSGDSVAGQRRLAPYDVMIVEVDEPQASAAGK
jgi:beta-galactosidase